MTEYGVSYTEYSLFNIHSIDDNDIYDNDDNDDGDNVHDDNLNENANDQVWFQLHRVQSSQYPQRNGGASGN